VRKKNIPCSPPLQELQYEKIELRDLTEQEITDIANIIAEMIYRQRIEVAETKKL